MHKTNVGFSLIEIMVAIAVVAVVATLVIPNIKQRTPASKRAEFIGALNSFVQNARESAITSSNVHRVAFDMKKRTIQVTAATGGRDEKGEPAFVRPKAMRGQLTMMIPENLEIKNFFIEAVDEMARYTGRETQEVWFYIMPEGVAQPVIINMLDKKDRTVDKQKRQSGLVLNPFNAQFKVYDTFAKP